uniref:hypothetical protein n=1 Tax=Stappia sp. TaxID=1870903 RepID=UPI003BA99D9D
MQCNRSLSNEAMDHIDHALGRPVNPLRPASRNYFAAGGVLADEMRRSSHWEEVRRHRGTSVFVVTDAGCQALAEHLREISDPHRIYIVSWARSGSGRCFAAKSAGKARYAAFLDVADVDPDLTFGVFCRETTVRVAR